MEAAVLKGPGWLAIEEVPDPVPGPGEVLARNTFCGICGSDLHLYMDPHTPPGSIMGHEFAGKVVEVGPGTSRFQSGDRVWPGGGEPPGWTWRPEYAWDLKAFLRDDYVRNMGAYGEYAVHHERVLAHIPDEVSDVEACMADQVGTALGGIRASSMRIGDSVLVTGAGPIGLWSLRCAQLAGARSICVSEPKVGRAEHARRMGADLVVDPAQDDVRERIVDFFGGAGADVVLECSGAESAANLAIELVRRGGRIALVGMSHEPISVGTLKMYLKGVQMSSVRDIDLTGGMDLLRQKRVDYREFVT